MIGGKYSLNQISQAFLPNSNTTPLAFNNAQKIDLGEDFALFGDTDSMFEIKYPETDIKIRVKRSSTVTTS